VTPAVTPTTAFAASPEMIRVYSPWPNGGAGSGIAAKGCGSKACAGEAGPTSSDNFCIHMVTLPGAAGAGPGSENESGRRAVRSAGAPSSATESARKRSVAPRDFGAGFGQSVFSTAGSELLACTGGGWIRGEGAGDGDAARNSWVKLASADAESEAPGEENPFIRGGLGGGGGAGLGTTRTVGSVCGGACRTKMRVTSSEVCLGVSRAAVVAGGGCGVGGTGL
jgi:hypothetical protein